MATISKTTTEHEEIRRWVEAHDGRPASVKRTAGKDDVGMIRIDFPGYSGEGTLEEISWDSWFEKFDESNLAFLYQEHRADGGDSRFCKLISRETAENVERGRDREHEGKAHSRR